MGFTRFDTHLTKAWLLNGWNIVIININLRPECKWCKKNQQLCWGADRIKAITLLHQISSFSIFKFVLKIRYCGLGTLSWWKSPHQSADMLLFIQVVGIVIFTKSSCGKLIAPTKKILKKFSPLWRGFLLYFIFIFWVHLL